MFPGLRSRTAGPWSTPLPMLPPWHRWGPLSPYALRARPYTGLLALSASSWLFGNESQRVSRCSEAHSLSEPLMSSSASPSSLSMFFFFFLMFIYLAALGLSCSMWDLVPQSEIEPTPTACGVLATALPGKSLPMFLIHEAPRVVPAWRKGQTPELRSS